MGIGQNGLFIRLKESVYRRYAAMETFDINNIDFNILRGVDIRTVDPDTLVDINDVIIDKSLPQPQRLADYIRQIRNPYCYKCGKAIVKVSFADTTATLEDRLEHYLKSL